MRGASLCGCVLALVAVGGGCSPGDDGAAGDETSATGSTGAAEPAASPLRSGLRGWQLAFMHVPNGAAQADLYVATADGTQLRRLDELGGDEQTPNWSPDGRRVAIRWVPKDYNNTPLLVIDAETGDVVNLTKRSGLRGWSPSWSPDGKRLVTAAQRGDETPGLYVMNADGSNPRRITPADREAQYATWSPDGTRIAFTFVTDGGFDLFTIRPDGSGLRRLTSDGAQGQNNWPMWSPDSTQIAWGKEEGIWAMNADGSRKRSVTEAGGVPAAWAPGPYISFGCPVDGGGQTLCAIRPDGTGLTQLLGGIDAGFPGWRPRTSE
jgi:dipeptidyl aminopeptidase/acylaminoacyl peptidase